MLRTCLAAGLVAGVAAAAQCAPDLAHGAQVYVRCMACHATAYDRVGPRHCGLIGRRAGSVPGFAYSAAMKKSQIVWDEKTLDVFLAHPLKIVPGTTMTYDGVPDQKDRADLVGYLKRLDDTAECRNLRLTAPASR
ncbi:cytochrome c family protein [Paucibacter sp. R3-3]|uniref:Cytochrome c family protein n=2 Tax=Roseateles agri TaxID=3098619 RepID=A0ABU5DS98_9BURK|nr:c-type cytochrome [Paucibacter sp. R3-3]MDY0749004.1 cytochrome c family protein [Paucibacter sp. R3-3]